MKAPRWKALSVLSLALIAGIGIGPSISAQTVTYTNNAKKFRGPIAHKDKESGTTIYIESDGRHVAAISAAGAVLWVRDPFVEAKLPIYRNKHPQIIYIGAPPERWVMSRKGKFFVISFNSTQTGVMDFETGQFEFRGQD